MSIYSEISDDLSFFQKMREFYMGQRSRKPKRPGHMDERVASRLEHSAHKRAISIQNPQLSDAEIEQILA